MGDMKLLRKVASLFLDDCPAMLSRIQAAIVRGDPEALRSEAHALKGSVANFAAARAVEAAAMLEALGRSGSLAEARKAYAVLSSEIRRLGRALEEFGPRGRDGEKNSPVAGARASARGRRSKLAGTRDGERRGKSKVAGAPGAKRRRKSKVVGAPSAKRRRRSKVVSTPSAKRRRRSKVVSTPSVKRRRKSRREKP
jgi:HPt (histidine-containing phosphotransfer) domain-containing protein